LDLFEVLSKAWPILLALITLIIVLAKLDLRVAVLEEKIKALVDVAAEVGLLQLGRRAGGLSGASFGPVGVAHGEDGED
jgi:hypothetical protein